MPSLLEQLIWLIVLAIPIACVSWTVTHEELFREFRHYCSHRSNRARSAFGRKFFYIFTCEYCFSHYVVAGFLAVTGFQLLYPDWRGYVVSGFALVFISNLYMGVFGQVKLGVKKDRVEIQQIETEVQQQKELAGQPGNAQDSSRRPAA